LHRPAAAGLDDVDVAVEMHAGPRARTLAPCHHVDARITVAVSRRPMGPHVVDAEAACLKPPADALRARTVGLAGRIDRGKADEFTRQLHEFVAPRFDD